MVLSVTFPQSVGGSGDTYHDGTGVGGMAEGGHALYFFPLLQQVLAVALHTEQRASDAEDSAVTAINAPGTSATTTTSITVGLGSKSFTLVETGKLFQKGQRVVVASNADPTKSVSGPITAKTGDPLQLTINCDAVGTGTGTFNDGIVSVSASAGVPPSRTITASGLATGGGDLSGNITITVPKASAAEIRTGTSVAKAVTPGDLMDAFAEVTLQFGSTITTSGDADLQMNKFINGRVTMAGNATLPNPTGLQVGDTGRIAFVQDATGGRQLTAWGSYYRIDGGKAAVTLSTAPGAVDYLYYDVVAANLIVCSFVKNPVN